jgi:catechol 2,3-dioxygenase-like lactoylglutathione lyase family enzyme
MTFANPMVNLYTRDLPAALAFYGGLMGFEESFRAPSPQAPDHVELRLDGVTLALSTAEAAEAGARDRGRAGRARLPAGALDRRRRHGVRRAGRGRRTGRHASA